MSNLRLVWSYSPDLVAINERRIANRLYKNKNGRGCLLRPSAVGGALVPIRRDALVASAVSGWMNERTSADLAGRSLRGRWGTRAHSEGRACRVRRIRMDDQT
jgi:hypothetical protein